jgi:hypothetical protein
VVLDSIRRWLTVRDVPPRTRAAAIVIAAVSAPMLRMATDNIEPTFALAPAMAALAYAAERGRNPATARRALLVAIAGIGFASLIYQGLILALAFIPTAIPWSTLKRLLSEPRTLLASGAILALAPVLDIAILAVAREGLHDAIELYTKHLRNPLINSFPRPSTANPADVTAALLVGPAGNVAALTNSHGMRALLASLRDPGRSPSAWGTVAILALGAVALSAIIWACVRRRDVALILALLGILVLPVVLRNQQSGYVKFFVLLPAFLSLGASYLRPRIAATLAFALALTNIGVLAREIVAGRADSGDVREFYATVPPNACFVTLGWDAPDGQTWKGLRCAALAKLGGDGSRPHMTVEELVQDNADRYEACLADCFCNASEVLTDDMTQASRGQVAFVLDHFQVHDLSVDPLLLSSEGAKASHTPAGMYAFPPDEQRRACASIEPNRTQARGVVKAR